MHSKRIVFLYLLLMLHSGFALCDLFPVKRSSVVFTENRGQWQEEVLYRGSAGDAQVSFLRNGLSFAQFTGKKSDSGYPVYQVWNMLFPKVSEEMTITGGAGSSSVLSYISGNDPSKWVIHPDQYKELLYNQIFQGIDLLWYGNGRDLKYDFIIHPDGSPGNIRSCWSGVSDLQINLEGELEITTSTFTQVQRRPVAWQIINGIKHWVNVEYELHNDTTFGFKVVDSYDSSYDLIIDPLFQMVWASYTQATGSSNNINYCFGNTMDNDGNVYLTGMVDSTFPITPGAYSGPGSVVPEIFVAKFSADGTTMLYSTYLPGNSSEHGSSIAVDDSGRAYITGIIDLNITGIQTYPSTPNAYQPVHDQASDAFLTVLTPDGTGLVYSTFLGGSNGETGYTVVTGGIGIAYITGSTSSTNFPVKNAPVFPSGTSDAFICKFDISQSGNNSLIYSVKIGGGQFNFCSGRGIAVNNAGNAFVTGTMGLGFGTMQFPSTPGAYSGTYNPGQDNIMSFVVKLSATIPITLEYSTYLVPGVANAIDIDEATGDVFIAGSTNTFAFPVTTGALQTVHGGTNGSDAYVIRLNASGSSLVYATFLGGDFGDTGTGIAANSAGEAYVTGIAQDLFPTSPSAYQTSNAGSYDFFAVHLNATGTGYGCGGSTYIGGSDADYSGSFYDYPSPRISLRDHGGINDTICISSTSHSQDFPTTPGVYGPVKVNSIADQPVFFKMTCFVTGVPPVAAFTSTVNPSCSGTTVDFSDNSQNGPSSWQWNFPGGTPSVSSQQNPSGILYTTPGTYPVTLIACNSSGCDSITSTVIISVPGEIPVSIGNDTTICSGVTVTLTAQAGLTSYTWLLNGVQISTSGNTLNASQAGQYIVQVTDSTGCTGSDTVEVDVSVPQVNLGNDISTCNGDSVLIQATSGYSNYVWYYNGSLITSQNEFIYASQPGSYVVEVTDSIGCIDTDTVQVFFGSVTVSLPPDTSFCEGGSFVLNAPPGMSGYEWILNNQTAGTSSSLSVTQSGQYILNVLDSAGCTGSDTITVTLHPLPVLNVTPDTTICTGTTLQLNATGAQSYIWNPGTYLSSTTISNPVATPLADITYNVTGTSVEGCASTESVVVILTSAPQALFSYTTGFDCNGIALITENTSINATSFFWDFGDGQSSTEISPVHYYGELNNETVMLIAFNAGCQDTATQSNITFAAPEVNIPNVFTPGSDGKNDCFTISGTEKLSGCVRMEIFNRWGRKVFKTEDVKCWDGRSDNGEELPAGIYYYIITLVNDDFAGSVHLLR